MKALIAVRKGSERIPFKNTRPFAGSSLLEIKIDQLKRIGLDVVVNSNCEHMLWIAKGKGCETVMRDDYYASSTVSANEFYANIAENIHTDIIVYCVVTCPLLKDDTIRKAIDLYEGGSVNTASILKEFLWMDGRPLNYDLNNIPHSQDLPDVSAVNLAVNVISKNDMIRCRNVVSDAPTILNIDPVEGFDIDYPHEFQIAEHLWDCSQEKALS